jgi:site-specific DNA-methyltransferase (adenine-specific)
MAKRFHNKIFCGSSSKMKDLPDNSVDLIFTSPPYEARKVYHTADGDIGRMRGDDFIDVLRPIMADCYRVLKPTGSFFLNFQGQYADGRFSLTEAKIPIVAVEDIGYDYIQPFYWTKTRPKPDNYNRRLKNRNEIIYHFAKDADAYAVYKDSVREPSRYQGHDQTCPLCSSHLKGKIDKRSWKYNPKGRDPGNVIFCKGATGQGSGDTWGKRTSKAKRDVHPALMPAELAEFFVKYGSQEGDLVLDPFMGSGTTGIAAAMMGRDFVGYDVSPKYVGEAQDRCNEAAAYYAEQKCRVAAG